MLLMFSIKDYANEIFSILEKKKPYGDTEKSLCWKSYWRIVIMEEFLD